MQFLKQITPFHMDVLKEIGNIGMGNAATALSSLINKKIDMKVPDVSVVGFNELMDRVGGSDQVLASVFLRIDGDAPGSMFFMLSTDQAARFINNMLGDDDQVTLDSPPYPEMALSALQEVGNILAGSYLTALSDFTNLKLHPTVPALSIDMAGAILTYGLIELSQVGDYAILIDTTFAEYDFPDADPIKGHFFLLPDPESFYKIFHAFGVDDDNNE